VADNPTANATDSREIVEPDVAGSPTRTPKSPKRTRRSPKQAPDKFVARAKRWYSGATDTETRRLAKMDSRLHELAKIIGRDADRADELIELERISAGRNRLLDDIWRRTARPQSERLVSRVLPTQCLFSPEELCEAKDRRVEEIEALHFELACGVTMGFAPVVAGQEQLHPRYWEVSQRVADETALYLDLGRLSHALDRHSALPAAETWLRDARTPSPLRSHERVRSVLASLCGEDFSLDHAIDASADDWKRLRTLQRAWTVNSLVLNTLEDAPERADQVRPSDLIRAANGGVAAWERLRVACQGEAEDERAPSPRVPTRLSHKRRWQAIWLKVKPQVGQMNYAAMADWVNKTTILKVSPDVLAEIIRAGDAGLLGR